MPVSCENICLLMKMIRRKRNIDNHSTLDCDYNNMKYLQTTVIDDNVLISFYFKGFTLSLAFSFAFNKDC